MKKFLRELWERGKSGLRTLLSLIGKSDEIDEIADGHIPDS